MSEDYCTICLIIFLSLLKQQDSVERHNTEHFMALSIEIE